MFVASSILLHWRVLLMLGCTVPLESFVIGPMGVVVKPVENIHIPLGSWQHALVYNYPCLSPELIAVAQGKPDNFLSRTLQRMLPPSNVTLSAGVLAEINATRSALEVQVADIKHRLKQLVDADSQGLGLFNNSMCKRIGERAKRALFAPWGKVLKSLWGLATEDDLRNVMGVVEAMNTKQEITEKQMAQLQIDLKQTTMTLRDQISRETNALNAQITELREAVFTQLEFMEAHLTDALHEVYRTMGYAAVVQYVQTILANIRILVVRKESLIDTIVSLAQSGIIPPALLPPSKSLEVLDNTQAALPSGYRILTAYYSGSLYTQRTSKVWGGSAALMIQMTFLIEMVVEDSQAWRVYSLPIFMGGSWAQYDVHDQVVLQTRGPDMTAVMSLSEYQACYSSPFHACTRGFLWRDKNSSSCAQYLTSPTAIKTVPCPLTPFIKGRDTQVAQDIFMMYLDNNAWYMSTSDVSVVGTLACIRPKKYLESLNIHHLQLISVSDDCTVYLPGIGKLVPFKKQFGQTTSNVSVYYPDVLFSDNISLEPWPPSNPPPLFNREAWKSQLGDVDFQDAVAKDTQAIHNMLRTQGEKETKLWEQQRTASKVLSERLHRVENMWSLGGQTFGNWLFAALIGCLSLWILWKCRSRLCCKTSQAAVIVSGSMPLVQSSPVNATWVQTQVVAHEGMPVMTILIPLVCSVMMAWVMYNFFKRSRQYHERILMASGWIGRNQNTLHHPGEVRLVAHFLVRFRSRWSRHEAISECPVQICTIPGVPHDWHCVESSFHPALNPPVAFSSGSRSVSIPMHWGPLCLKNKKWATVDSCADLPKMVKVDTADLTLPLSGQLPFLFWTAQVLSLSRLSVMASQGGASLYSDHYGDKK